MAGLNALVPWRSNKSEAPAKREDFFDPFLAFRREIDRMFDRFEQGSSGTQGLGLGLYITRQIVESHGGSIEGFSPPGEGATFVVTLPRIAEHVRRTPSQERA